MRLGLVKRLVTWLAIIAFLGGTWAQASAGSLDACARSRAVMPMEMLLHEMHSQEAVSDDVATAKNDSGAADLLAADLDRVATSKAELAKSATADCVKAQNCTSLPALPQMGSLLFKDWKQVVQSTLSAAVRGRSLDPELSPPNERL